MLMILAAAAVHTAPAKPTTPLYMDRNGSAIVLPAQVGECAGTEAAQVCTVSRNGALFLRLAAPPCKTGDAIAAGRCIPWEIVPDLRFQVVIPPPPPPAPAAPK